MLKDGGANVSNYEGYVKNSYNYLELPINLAYKMNKVQLLAGPYLAFGVNGTFKHDFSFEVDGTSFNSDDFFDQRKYELQPVFGTVGNDRLDDYNNDDNAIELGSQRF
ncbi:MAG: hypothetical protein HC803_12170 [Saprospiraceae bacterium]|nr:hypothetical protein [Saprospiraceae bacterium]